MPIKTSASGVPAGTVAYFAANAVPAGWLKANGAAVSRTAYAALFLVIGTTYGAGNGSTTFNLPDCRGEFLRGLDDGRGVDAGRVIGGSQGDAVIAHTHYIKRNGNASQGPDQTGFAAAGFDGNNNGPIATYTQSPAGATETRPRNIAMLACIKF